jgi:hypothetical protein
MDRFSREYFGVLDQAHSGIAGISSQIIEHDSFRDVVPDFFTLLFHVIRATTPVLQYAFDQTALDAKGGGFGAVLHDFYGLKIKEESGHDVMLAKDLERLGRSRQELERELPPASIVSLVGSQYYLITFCHPAVYLGYVGLLEGYPIEGKHLQELVRRSGLPEETWSTYRVHGELDPWHREELEGILDQVPADPGLRSMIITNGLRSGEFYCQALEEILAKLKGQRA